MSEPPEIKTARITIEQDGEKLVLENVTDYAMTGVMQVPSGGIPIFMQSRVGYLPHVLGLIAGLKEHVERWPTTPPSQPTP